VRAWTIYNGTLAPGAAGVIHSDFERGFIKAETVRATYARTLLAHARETEERKRDTERGRERGGV